MEQHINPPGTENVPITISSASPTPTRPTFNIPPPPLMDSSDPIEPFSDAAPQGMGENTDASLPPVAVLDTDSHMNSPNTNDMQYVNLDIPPSGVPTDSTQYGGGSLVGLPPARQFMDDAFPDMALDGVVDGEPAIAHQNLRGIPLRNLSDETRHIVQEEAAKLGQGPVAASSPVVTRSRSSSVSSVHSQFTNVLVASADSDADAVFRRAQSIPIPPEDYFADLETALKVPVMFEPLDISGMDIPDRGIGYMDGQKQELISQTNDLLHEIGHDVSTMALGYGHFYLSEAIRLRTGSTIPASADDFNDSLGMVINAIDIGVDEHMEHWGLTPSSWYRASTAILAAMLRGLLRSRDGVERPRTQGGRIAAMATQLAQHFKHYMVQDDAPLVTYLQSVIWLRKQKNSCIGMRWFERKLRALSVRRWWTNFIKRRWQTLVYGNNSTSKCFFKHYEKMLWGLLQPRLLTIEGRISELWDQVARGELSAIFKEEELECVRAEVWLKCEGDIESACQETRAQISSKKKAWAVAYRDSVKMDFLKRMAEELGCLVVTQDAAEECEGRTRKHAIPEGRLSWTLPLHPLRRRRQRARDMYSLSLNLFNDLQV
ncbi:hypothetical protein BJY52DRAFT_1230106 [Lactarius psammicola]|nr:hypothetical protein BJY52DRAFT_1230106 [Lactarius psammicola]